MSGPGESLLGPGPIARPPVTDPPVADGGGVTPEGLDWAEELRRLSSADLDSPLGPEDLERLAVAAYLIGEGAQSEEAWTRAHQEHLNADNAEGAARCAFWLAFQLLNSVDKVRGMGWMARAGRLLEGVEGECVEQGYLLFFRGLQSVFAGKPDVAQAVFAEAAAVGEHFRDPDLIALARHGVGRALLRQGRTVDGIRLLDEVMVAVTMGEVGPVVSGDVYCSVIEACHEIFDLPRAAAWTDALNRWCEARPQVVPYRGTCLVRRSEIMQLHGEWPGAAEEAERARDRLSDPPGQPALGAAFYQLAELHRLRGEFARAEAAYEKSSEHGRDPQPGVALLRMAQKRPDAALASIGRALEDSARLPRRASLLAAFVEISLAVDDISAAERAGAELTSIAEEVGAPLLHGLAARARGAALLSRGDARGALRVLNEAMAVWIELSAPYEAARTRVHVARACRALDDPDSGRRELTLARRTFQRLGAAPDLERVHALHGGPGPPRVGGLTKRQAEVLKLVATGRTNRQIAMELFISEKTVARHVSNIFGKLGVETRAAATAFAFRNDLV